MTDCQSEDVCQSCGQTERESLDSKSRLMDTVHKQHDEMALGMKVECSDCGRRLDPKEHIKVYSDDGEVVADGTDVTESFNHHLEEYYGESPVEAAKENDNEEVNFLDEGTFRYGMD